MSPPLRKPMTLTQKILAHHARGLTRPWVEAGDILQIAVDWTIASELAWNGMDRTYSLLGRPAVHDKNRFFLAIDHTVDAVTLATDPRAQRLTQLSRDFAKEQQIRHFYDAKRVTFSETHEHHKPQNTDYRRQSSDSRRLPQNPRAVSPDQLGPRSDGRSTLRRNRIC